jgi:hypothetical protein
MVNEENVKYLLSSWLHIFGVQAYWEKKNRWNYPLFLKDGANKPDLLIKNKTNNRIFVIEVKDADGGNMNVNNSFTQICSYAKDDEQYYIDSETIHPCGYLVATQNSLKGYLFNNETIRPPGEGRKFSIMRGQTPIIEYNDTFQFIRLLWRNAKAMEINLPTGILISNVVNNSYSIAPLLFYKAPKWSTQEIWS